MAKQHILAKAERLRAFAEYHSHTWQGRSACESVAFYEGVVEPGYDDKPTALGNWNTITTYSESLRESIVIDKTPARLSEVLERMGIEIQREDEWSSCGECNRLFRTQPDSYSWQRSYVETDDGGICLECIDPVEHLEALEGEDSTCNTIDSINPASHGYILVKDSFQNGLHPGQAADPKLIGKALRAAGIERYLFNLDNVGQFDASFSVYIHKSERRKLKKALKALEENPTDMSPSPAENCERALRSIPAIPNPDGGILYSKVDVGTGTATTRIVSPEEFIKGIKD